MNESISVIIPCLNEAETIAAAVAEAKEGIALTGLAGEVIVADNGSTDGSQAIAQKAGARVVPVPVRGYGAALHHGILSADSEYVVFADADLSYPFIELPKLIQVLQSGRCDFVLGSRLKGTLETGAMPWANRRIGTPILSSLIRLLYRIPTSDCNSGMRAFRRSGYEQLRLNCPGMEYASEMIIRVAQTGMKYGEVPIGFRKDRRDRPPHLRRWRDGWRHLRFILGNAPSLPLIVFPGVFGSLLLLIAFFLSLDIASDSRHQIHFHSAFALVAMAMPLLLLTVALLLVRTARHEAGLHQSRIVASLHELSENSAPFYIAMFLYLMAALQIGLMFVQWRNKNFQDLMEIGATIRVIVISTFATIIFSLDLGLGLLRLIPYNNDRSQK